MPITLHTPDGDVTFSPEQDELTMPLTELLRRRNVPLNTRCGQRGLCDSCRLELEAGGIERIEDGECITANGESHSVRACQVRLGAESQVTLTVPKRAIAAHAPQAIDAFRINIARAHQPLWPSRETDPWFDAKDNRLPKAGPPLGAAIDVGTTTVALLLVNLDTGDILARTSRFNEQMHYGDNVLTRINLCINDKSLIDRQQEAVINETIAPLLAEALTQAQAQPEQVVSLTVAANTTMLHLLAGVDPSSLGTAPFEAQFLNYMVHPLKELDFRWPVEVTSEGHRQPARNPRMHLLPSAAGYIGSDLTGGIVASNLPFDPGTAMLVDIGTNGEIILKHDDHTFGCATAAGPAFEGSKLIDGVRAGRGAISRLHIDPQTFDISYEVIGQQDVFSPTDKPREKPFGICGSAYVDFLAQGIQTGMLLPTGRYNLDAFPPAARETFSKENRKCHGPCMRVAWGQGKEPLFISEADIASLLQAKAAIAAGILTLLEKVGLTPADVDTLHLAGGFGMHIHLPSAIACGLLRGFSEQQIQVVGNTALAGAYMALIDRSSIEEMTDAAQTLEVVELNLEPSFQDHFIDQLSL